MMTDGERLWTPVFQASNVHQILRGEKLPLDQLGQWAIHLRLTAYCGEYPMQEALEHIDDFPSYEKASKRIRTVIENNQQDIRERIVQRFTEYCIHQAALYETKPTPVIRIEVQQHDGENHVVLSMNYLPRKMNNDDSGYFPLHQYSQAIEFAKRKAKRLKGHYFNAIGDKITIHDANAFQISVADNTTTELLSYIAELEVQNQQFAQQVEMLTRAQAKVA